jgi:molybdenum cofactor cytidylyltransferase
MSRSHPPKPPNPDPALEPVPGHTGIVIMAGGASRRLGRPKQLLDHGGLNLLSHTADAALSTGIRPVIVVLGAEAEAIRPSVEREGVTTVVNPDWREGMASSLRTGLQHLIDAYPQVESAILMVCDQPYVSAGIIQELLHLGEQTGLPVAACTYAGRMGTPALFHQSLFRELLRLEGDTGARKWLSEHPESVATLPFGRGELDIDTPEDLDRWNTYRNTDPS